MKINGIMLKSDNALKAEDEGRFPLTTASKLLRLRLADHGVKVTLAVSRKLLQKFGNSGEWHHVGKLANG